MMAQWLGVRVVLVAAIVSALCLWRGDASPVLLQVNTTASIATTDEVFLCATMDWWPIDKCDYGTCSWDNASMLNLDLSNQLLEKALLGLSPFRIRLGGSLQDEVVYEVGNPQQPCVPFVKNGSHIFGFQGGCLSMGRWSDLNNLFNRTGTQIAFGLNALYNRQRVAPNIWGPWDSANAHDFIKFTVDQGYQVQAWELGNELSGSGVGTSITAKQYAADVKELRRLIDTLYLGANQKPLLVSPDGFFTVQWYKDFLNAVGPGVVDVITRHIYNLGPGVSTDLVEKILNPTDLNNEVKNFQAVRSMLQKYGPGPVAWIGEAGGAYNSGHHLVTDAFVFSFWYLDQLGQAASFNTKAYCRQSFIGGNYGLLNTTTYEPNPDYYSALLWSRLMGRKVLSTNFKGSAIQYLRVYTHCEKQSTTGGVTILLINLSNTTTYTVAVSLASQTQVNFATVGLQKATTTSRLEYHLTALNGNLQSQTMLLNGNPLVLTPAGDLPTLSPLQVQSSTPIAVAPYSIAFVVVPDAGILVCQGSPI